MASASASASAATATRQQSTSCIVMVRPDHFRYNDQTGETNAFQKQLCSVNDATGRGAVRDQALREFDNFQIKLRENGVRIVTLSSRVDQDTPDEVFPNNWFSVHSEPGSDGPTLVLYPMFNENRRLERQPTSLAEALYAATGKRISQIVDLSHWERAGKALEGTGSLILDRINRVAYASRSLRTDSTVLQEFCDKLGYESVLFSSTTEAGPIYHTNVMMSIGSHFAVLCKESITDVSEAQIVEGSLRSSGHEIIYIDMQQLSNMCGNVLELRGTEGGVLIAMSTRARSSFTESQIAQLCTHGTIVDSDINTIETVGGGSARCMIGEVFLNE
jgi:hypothetical protein